MLKNECQYCGEILAAIFDLGSMNNSPVETAIIEKEERLREWFTRECDQTQKVIDGLDIGWGGTQRWTTSQMLNSGKGLHLDIACGYGTFLAQLGWRFPDTTLVGLNIDFVGPHAIIRKLLSKAGVRAQLIQGDTRYLPFADGVFKSVSCFIGLQDIKIGFGEKGVNQTLMEVIRVICTGGVFTVLEEFTFEYIDYLTRCLPIMVIKKEERALNVQWNREIAERAIVLYAKGWVEQSRLSDPETRALLYNETMRRMTSEMDHQLATNGYYVPFGPIRMVVMQKKDKLK